jgi:hypothetical protein
MTRYIPGCICFFAPVVAVICTQLVKPFLQQSASEVRSIDDRIMPRIIEAKIGKVAGPLRMKVAPTSSSTLSTTHTPNSEGRNHSPTLLSEQEVRRGRYSRRHVNGSKKSRSKSLPSTNQAAFLFGKPPDDVYLQDTSIDYPIKIEKSNVDKNEDLRTATPQDKDIARTGTSAVNKFDPSVLTQFDDNLRSNFTFTEPSQHRYALALDTRCLLTSARTGRGSESLSVAECIIRNCKVLTKSLHSRGITPCIVTSTVASDKARSCLHYTHENERVAAALADLGLGIETHKFFHGDNRDSAELKKAIKVDDDTWYTKVEIPTTKLNTGALSIPLPLNATYSWLLFSAMGTLQMKHLNPLISDLAHTVYFCCICKWMQSFRKILS